MSGRLSQWLRAIAHWLWDGREGWGPLLIAVGIVIAASSITKVLDDGLRYAGLILQILGVVTVAIGLRDRRQTFQKLGLPRLFLQWLARFPRYAPKPHIISAQGIASASAVGSAYGFGWHGVPDNATVEDRLVALQKNLDTVKQLALDAQKQAQVEAAKLDSKLEAERREREASDRALGAKLESVGAGNLHLEGAGVFWLIVGVVLGTAPNEMAALVGWFR